MMHDLTKIQKTFDELFLSRFNEEIFIRNDIHEDEELIKEDLFEIREVISIPFGSLFYFLALEDEKPVLYVELASRMGTHDIYIIEGDSYTCYDIFDGYPPELKEKIFGHMKNIKETKDRMRIKKK